MHDAVKAVARDRNREVSQPLLFTCIYFLYTGVIYKDKYLSIFWRPLFLRAHPCTHRPQTHSTVLSSLWLYPPAKTNSDGPFVQLAVFSPPPSLQELLVITSKEIISRQVFQVVPCFRPLDGRPSLRLWYLLHQNNPCTL